MIISENENRPGSQPRGDVGYLEDATLPLGTEHNSETESCLPDQRSHFRPECYSGIPLVETKVAFAQDSQ